MRMIADRGALLSPADELSSARPWIAVHMTDGIPLMETFKRTPLQLFNLPQHFFIPLFQRPYVWREEEQWAPLWSDIRRVAERRIDDPRSTVTHFLGAVVL